MLEWGCQRFHMLLLNSRMKAEDLVTFMLLVSMLKICVKAGAPGETRALVAAKRLDSASPPAHDASKNRCPTCVNTGLTLHVGVSLPALRLTCMVLCGASQLARSPACYVELLKQCAAIGPWAWRSFCILAALPDCTPRALAACTRGTQQMLLPALAASYRTETRAKARNSGSSSGSAPPAPGLSSRRIFHRSGVAIASPFPQT